MTGRKHTKRSLALLFFISAFLCTAPALLSQSLFIDTQPPADIYHDGWIDFNKNGSMDLYEDPHADSAGRIENLLALMNVEEKTMQLVTLYGYGRVAQEELPDDSWNKRIWKDGIGNIDEHLNGVAYHPAARTEYSWPPSKHARAINQVQRFFVEDTRLGIPADFTNEGIRGLCHHGATSFPAQIGQGSTWDKELINRIGRITGREARILGYTNVYSPILDVARDPRWGRTVECYGEDPFLVSSLGMEMIRGIQSQNVASTGKHFAVYSVPKGGRDGRVRTDPHATERDVHEILIRPFRDAVRKAGILGLMSSYNDYNGIPVTGSRYFLTELLRGQWGFRGYIVSDSSAVINIMNRHYTVDNYKECVYQAVMAGLNVRTDFNLPSTYVRPLRELIAEGRVPMDVIDERVRDVLRVKFALGLFDSPYVGDPDAADGIVAGEEHMAAALRSARESLVLLKNDSLLPIDIKSIKSILVTGPNAKAVNPMISRYGPSNIDVKTVVEGIREYAGGAVNVQYSRGCDHYDMYWPENEILERPISKKQKQLITKAYEKAKDADLIVVVVGDDQNTVGESKSRTSLGLPGNQGDLVKAMVRTGKPVVLVLINGRPLTINWANRFVPAIIEAWFPSVYCGRAIAEAIFGDYNPGGKLPVTFPKTVGQIPYNFPWKRSSQLDQPIQLPERFNSRVNGPLYPFGHGLSYTTFEYSDLEITPVAAAADSEIKVSFNVKNTGGMKGDEVPQLYIGDVTSSVVTYKQRLRGFERISLEPDEIKQVRFVIEPREHLAIFDRDMRETVEPGLFELMVGSSSADIRLKGEFTIVE